MSESVLERSVLERKERDELQAIARAMGAQPGTRAKKADLVEMILTTAGIGPGGNGAAAEVAAAKPRRRSRSSSPEAATFDLGTTGAEPRPEGPEAGATEAGPDEQPGGGAQGHNGERPVRSSDDVTATADRTADGEAGDEAGDMPEGPPASANASAQDV
ncbi:MAG: hypothetical protein ACR2K0_06825, partial [Acidimicrobiales bacterium]